MIILVIPKGTKLEDCEDIILLGGLGTLLRMYKNQKVISIHDISNLDLKKDKEIIWFEGHGDSGYFSLTGTKNIIPAIKTKVIKKSFDKYVEELGKQNISNIKEINILSCASGVQTILKGTKEKSSLVDSAVKGLENLKKPGILVTGFNGYVILDPTHRTFHVDEQLGRKRPSFKTDPSVLPSFRPYPFLTIDL